MGKKGDIMEQLNIRFSGERLSPWLVSHYIEQFSTYMARLEVCLQLARQLSEGEDPRRIFLIQKSSDLWLPKLIKPSEQLWIALGDANKKLNPDFFYYLNRIKRPSPWVLRDNTPALLIDVTSPEFIYLKRVQFNSPGEVSFNIGLGIAEIIRELRYGKAMEKRRKEEHVEIIRQKKLENQIREQELLGVAMENVLSMEELKELPGEYQIQIGNTLEVNIGGLKRLNENADGSTMLLPEDIEEPEE